MTTTSDARKRYDEHLQRGFDGAQPERRPAEPVTPMEALTARCRCGGLLAEDGRGCQWHTSVQAAAIRAVLADRATEAATDTPAQAAGAESVSVVEQAARVIYESDWPPHHRASVEWSSWADLDESEGRADYLTTARALADAGLLADLDEPDPKTCGVESPYGRCDRPKHKGDHHATFVGGNGDPFDDPDVWFVWGGGLQPGYHSAELFERAELLSHDQWREDAGAAERAAEDTRRAANESVEAWRKWGRKHRQERDEARARVADLEADNARLTVEAKVCREDAEENATRAERAEARVADLERQNGLLLRQAEEHWGHRQRSEARVADLEAEVERLEAGGIADVMAEKDDAEARVADLEAEVERWTEKAQEAGKEYADANTKHHEELDRANRLERLANTLAERAVDLEDGKRAAEARARRAEDALRRMTATARCVLGDNRIESDNYPDPNLAELWLDVKHADRALAGQTSDATPSDTTTDTLTIDPKRLTWDQRIPSAYEFGTWVESLPAGEFATGLLIIADALREREKRQADESATSSGEVRDA